jgi:hypothetical protein
MEAVVRYLDFTKVRYDGVNETAVFAKRSRQSPPVSVEFLF